tara:strand:+ start:1362 stop:1574 length:213 start_codon:yes stop_codon:yes gene_type:complete
VAVAVLHSLLEESDLVELEVVVTLTQTRAVARHRVLVIQEQPTRAAVVLVVPLMRGQVFIALVEQVALAS